MRIAIFNDFQLPLPAVKGGSVACLTDFIIEQNEIKQKFDIDVFSCYNEEAEKKSKDYKCTRFIYSKTAHRIRFFTNLGHILKFKFHLPIDISSIKLPREVRKAIKNQQYDLVYINGYIRGALDIMKNIDAPAIVHHHVVTDLLAEKSIKGKTIIDNSCQLLFDSEFAARYTKGANEEQNAKMAPYLNAIDTKKFNFENKEQVRAEIRKKYNIQPDDIVILFVGRMVESKGTYELIKSFNQCGFPSNVKLLMVGASTYSSKKVSQYVSTCIEEAKKNDNIIFTGYISYGEVPKYYIASDISTLLSRCHEACGLVGIESMAAGLPVITTDRGGIGEYVTSECKIVTPDDEELVNNIQKALEKLVSDPELRKKMGDAGIERARLFDKVEYFDRFVEIVEKAVSKGKRDAKI